MWLAPTNMKFGSVVHKVTVQNPSFLTLATQWNSEILIQGCPDGSNTQPNVVFFVLDNKFENVNLMHGTKIGNEQEGIGVKP